MGLYRTSKSNSCLPPYLFVPARGDAEVCPVLGHQLMLDPNGDVHEGEGVQLGQHRIEPIHHGLGSWVNISVSDPDPDWIRIQSGLWIRIGNPDPDPDPGARKVAKIHC